MRNLRRTRCSSIERDKRPLTACAWDVNDGGSIICAFGPTKDDPLLEVKRWKNDEPWANVASWDAKCPLPSLECDKIVNLKHFSDISTNVLVLAGGDLIVVREDPANEEKIEIVGSVDDGISAAVWSPDEELLLLVSTSSIVFYMTKDFDNMVTFPLTNDDLKVSTHVSVGWGKEVCTIPTGNRLVYLRLTHWTEHTEPNSGQETQFKGKKARALRDPTIPETVDDGSLIPNEDGHITLSWRGDGSYVAINSIQGSRRVIRVLSREGVLESVSEPVNHLTSALSWRPAGNIIAGIQRLEKDCKVVFFEKNGLRHGDFSLRLIAADIDTWASSIELRWNIDSTVLAVIFNDRVQLWQMSNYHYYLKQEIHGPDSEISALHITDSVWHPEKPLHLAFHNAETVQKCTFTSTVATSSTHPPHDYGAVAVIDGKTLKLTSLRLANIPPPMASCELDMSRVIDDVVFRTVEGRRGLEIATLDRHETSLFDWEFQSEPRLVRKAAYSDWDMLVDGAKDAQSERFSLDEQGTLSTPNRRIASGVTSYLATHAHLLYTSKNLLKFVHLLEDDAELEIPADTPELDERCRSIERGAKLITVMPSIFAVVLQMPRGNLETVYPRVLVLAGIRDNINRKQYKKAFLACRNHRVDMNILHDHAPSSFLANVGLFVEQVKKTEYIDLFLSQLRDEDVSKSMYRETLMLNPGGEALADDISQPGKTIALFASKVNSICDRFLLVLEERPSEYLQNIVSAHVCKTPSDQEGALKLTSKLSNSGQDVESIIEHICFLADVNRLYDNALGIYDLKLALLIAQRSQKDPKEYLPFLQNLQEMTPLRRQFSIDDCLKRYAKALGHLCDMDAFDEVTAYVVDHELYNEAICYYRYQESNRNELVRLYAAYLQKVRMFKEAGIAYESLGDHNSASESFRQAHLWQESLSNAVQAELQSSQLYTLALSLSDALVETKDYSAAATINLEYLSDTPTAARLFCKGYHFSDAVRIAGLYQRLDLLESVIDPGLQEGMATMTELLAECKNQLDAQVPRLRELRTKKIEDPLAFWEGEAPGGGDVPDDISIAPTDASTTGGSLFTRYTNRTGTVGTNATRRTSKNKRREERKRARGKKGSVYEEEYLVNSIERLIQRVNAVGDEVSRLVSGLVRRGMREQGRSVENAMVEVVGMCKDCVGEVFGVKRTIDAEDGEGAQKPRDLPLVSNFERLKLLGG